jgi:hypothetical protein
LVRLSREMFGSIATRVPFAMRALLMRQDLGRSCYG